MKVLFVHSTTEAGTLRKPLQSLEQMQFGVSYISAVLKEHGHETRLVVLNSAAGLGTRPLLKETFEGFSPGLVCFTAVATEIDFIRSVAEVVRREVPGAFLLAGGPHVSLNPEQCGGDPFDAVCVGEGEYPTLELADCLEQGGEPSGIMNLWIRSNQAIERNPTRPFVADLDRLPFPDREMWLPWLDSAEVRRTSVLLGRGCPFSCTYCSNHALRSVAGGEYVRFRSPDNIVREIEHVAASTPSIEELYLEVETIPVRKDWFRGLCDNLRRFNAGRSRRITFGTNVRITPNADYDDMFAAFKQAGFRFVNIGLESGSERIRRDVLSRRYANDDVIRATDAARAHGIQVCLYNMIGLPCETWEDFRETVEVNRRVQPDWHMTSVFYPYPGTALYRTCVEDGLLPGAGIRGLERRTPVLRLAGFPRWKVYLSYIGFEYLVYHGHRSASRVFLRMLITALASRPVLNRVFRALLKVGLLRRLKMLVKGGHGPPTQGGS